jgi:hypothetical protein
MPDVIDLGAVMWTGPPVERAPPADRLHVALLGVTIVREMHHHLFVDRNVPLVYAWDNVATLD